MGSREQPGLIVHGSVFPGLSLRVRAQGPEPCGVRGYLSSRPRALHEDKPLSSEGLGVCQPWAVFLTLVPGFGGSCVHTRTL